jgi:putative transposase
LVTLARLARPGGIRAVAAESLAVKHQLLIMKRSRRRGPNLTRWDRVILGFCTLLMSPRRLSKVAVVLKTSTLLSLHRALVKRNIVCSMRPSGAVGPDPRARPQN